MCWEIDYKFFAEQKKAQEARIKQEQRAGVIDQLRNEAHQQGDIAPSRRTAGQRDCTCKIAGARRAALVDHVV